MLRSWGKFLLRKSVGMGIGEPLYRRLTKSWPETVAQRIKLLRSFAGKYHTPVFVETGTHLGDTTWGVHDVFKKIYTIEIEPNFAALARRRFKHEKNITVLEGDSATVLQQLSPTLNERALFFLDAHFSGGISGKGSENTPLRDEFAGIASSPLKNHIIVIDDAHECTGQNGYPSQSEIFAMLHKINPAYTVGVVDNCIVATL